MIVASASPAPSVDLHLAVGDRDRPVPSPSMSKRYELFMPAMLRRVDARLEPSKNSLTLATLDLLKTRLTGQSTVYACGLVDLDLTPEHELAPGHRPASSRVRARRAGRRGARPREALPLRARRRAGRARADGDDDPRGVRRRRHRHALVRDRRRGADAGRLVGRDHRRRAPLARDAADLDTSAPRSSGSSGSPTSRRAGSSPRSA